MQSGNGWWRGEDGGGHVRSVRHAQEQVTGRGARPGRQIDETRRLANPREGWHVAAVQLILDEDDRHARRTKQHGATHQDQQQPPEQIEPSSHRCRAGAANM